MTRYYGLKGEPLTLEQWATYLESNLFDRIVGKTCVGESWISTVWLGLDHQYMPDGPPLIFETMIFDGPYDQYIERYSTFEQAKDGHLRIVINLYHDKEPDDQR